MDSYAIAGAIATRFSAANVSPPSGYEDIKVSTADLPQNISLFPTVLVMPPGTEAMGYNASRSRSLTLNYGVVLFLSRSDGSPRRAKAVHDWFTALYGQLAGQMMLGLSSYVALAYVSGMVAATVTYGGEDFDGLRFVVTVKVNEAYTPVA